VAGGTAAAVHAAGRDIGEGGCAVDAIEVVISRVGAVDLCLAGLDGIVGLGDAVVVFCSARHDDCSLLKGEVDRQILDVEDW
jgi:hypothetical protein